MKWTLKITEIINALLPWFLRKTRIRKYLESIAAPITDQNADFTAFAQESLYRVAITGQVIYLQQLMNDLFDNTLRRIVITDFSVQAQLYAYQKAETPVTFAYQKAEEEKTFAYTRTEVAESYRFAVVIPVVIYDTLTTDQFNQMRANLNKHKTAGTTYVIIST